MDMEAPEITVKKGKKFLFHQLTAVLSTFIYFTSPNAHNEL